MRPLRSKAFPRFAVKSAFGSTAPKKSEETQVRNRPEGGRKFKPMVPVATCYEPTFSRNGIGIYGMSIAAVRLNYAAIAPEATKALAGVNAALLRSGLDKRLMDLLFLRVSQINGCSYCVDLHARDLREAGEVNERLDGLAGWRESPYFTAAEKTALEWAEALTRVEATHAPDSAYEPLARHYDGKQVANITYAIALMNAWNRVAIGFHEGPRPHPEERRSA